jgi:hypothetical protein
MKSEGFKTYGSGYWIGIAARSMRAEAMKRLDDQKFKYAGAPQGYHRVDFFVNPRNEIDSLETSPH